MLFCFHGQIFSIDLTNEIATSFQKYYDKGFVDDYLNLQYYPEYSKDPFKDSLKSLDGMSQQLKISWVQYVENALSSYKCSLEQKKVWAILYHFVPDFRAEIARALKMELWDINSRNFVYNKKEIESYCEEYIKCFENNNKNNKEITSDSPKDPMTSCQEFFEKYYFEWENKEKRFQNVQISQLWADKFRNSTLDDSPYDIMTDLWNVWMLMYEGTVLPITPVFYNLPLFSNSKNSLKELSDWVDSTSSSPRRGVWWSWRITWDNLSGWWTLTWRGWAVLRWDWSKRSVWFVSLSTGTTRWSISTWIQKIDLEWWYDKLVEWLWSYSLKWGNSLYYWSLCEDDNKEDSLEPEYLEEVETPQVEYTSVWRDVSLTDSEYEEVIDYMLGAVDKYASLPEDVEEEIKIKAWDVSDYNSATTEWELEEVANKIKNCWQSCEGLRIDQKASCMLMCACWEIKSPIFNPDNTPWLWPIFMIRFCSIPAVNTNFSVWWRKIVSIEEWIREIYGVTDKLSREWRLWIWTPQYNFLDSTTKEIKIADSLSFTVDVEWVDITEKLSNQSTQYKKRVMKVNNKDLQSEYNISNSLDNNVLKNHYRLVGYEWEVLDDLRASTNVDDVKNRMSDLSVTPWFIYDQLKLPNTSRYGDISQTLNSWLDQQWNFWVNTMWYIVDLDSYAQALYAKK